MPQTTLPPLAQRQLNAVSSDYPGWDITVSLDDDIESWKARRIKPVTDAMNAKGVEALITAPDCITLTSALSRQVTLVHNWRAA